MPFNASEVPEWVLHDLNIWNQVESQSFEKLAIEPIKGEDKYIHDEMKMSKKESKQIFMVKAFHMTVIAMQQQC